MILTKIKVQYFNFFPVWLLAFGLFFTKANAQIAKTSIVEHFTNTSCGICAANNPSFMAAIGQTPQTLHISFHPSSPYINDVFNVQNRLENDARTNFYGVFGATPRLVHNGSVVPNGGLQVALSSSIGATSAYSLQLRTQRLSAGNYQLSVQITKVSADSLEDALLFLGLVEDTIHQLTNNGEAVHFHVFRKSIGEINGNSVNLPTAIGDSVDFSYSLQFPMNRDLQRWFVLGILQQNNKNVIQSARSENLTGIVSSSIYSEMSKAVLFPNPLKQGLLYSKRDLISLRIYNAHGNLVAERRTLHLNESWDLSNLSAGFYHIVGLEGSRIFQQTLIVQP